MFSLALILIIISKLVSLVSIMAAILFPVLTIFIQTNYIEPGNYIIFGIAVGLLVVFNHRKNLKRILEGNENKISFKK